MTKPDDSLTPAEFWDALSVKHPPGRPGRPGRVTKHRLTTAELLEERAAQAAKIQALQDALFESRARYRELSGENEAHAAQAREAIVFKKERDRERAKNANIESALETAQKRIRSLEESCRRLLAEHDAQSAG